MTDAYVVEVSGRTAFIVVRDSIAEAFYFFAAARALSSLEGRQFRENPTPPNMPPAKCWPHPSALYGARTRNSAHVLHTAKA